MTYEGWPDALRYIIIAAYGTLLVFAVQILVCYREAERATRRKRHRELLTRHVLTITSSYLVLATEAVYENIIRLGDPFTGYIPVNGFGFFFGIYALNEMLKFERRRVDIVTGDVVVEKREVAE